MAGAGPPIRLMLIGPQAVLERLAQASFRASRAVRHLVVFDADGGTGGLESAALIADARPTTSRLAEADRLQHLLSAGAKSLALTAEPAPYSMPPVDLFRWQIVLLPRGAAIESSTADVTLRATDDVPPSPPALPQARDLPSHYLPTRISWAAKPFEVRERGDGR